MTRRHVAFEVLGDGCAGTLDEATGKTGLLIVSGGSETRAGAFGGQARLAARIAAAGYPVFRFDRRGVGDSEGANRSYRDSGEDIAAALATFRREAPAMQRVVAFGNCDGASAIVLHRNVTFDAQVLANPWVFQDCASPDMAPAEVRERYASRLKDPRQWLRLLRGEVSLAKLLRGLRRAAASRPANPLADGIAGFSGPTRILVARRDRTGRAFMESWDRSDPRLRVHETADHGFSGDALKWLELQLVSALEETDKLDMG